MQKIEIYTRPGCGYCTHAKRLFTNSGVSFIEYDVYQQPEYLEQMWKRTTGRTFPQIFIEDKAVGGFSELLVLEQSGELLKKQRTRDDTNQSTSELEN